MTEDFARDIAAVQGIDGARDILRQVRALTGMGFAAIARVTARRWIACLVTDDVAQLEALAQRIADALDAGRPAQ